MTQTILTATNLSYRRQGKLILNQCGLHLVRNEVVALIGANGAGKTTLLHLLAGLKTPDSGQMQWGIKRQGEWLGYLPDKAPLYPSMLVYEFLCYCAHIRGLKFVTQAVDDVIARCGLSVVVNQRCGALSHGYQQRVGLAQAIIHQPQMIFLDEPTNGLDYGQKKALRPLLSELGTRASVLMISHDYEEIIATADRVYLLNAGKLYELPLPAKTDLWWLTLPDNIMDNLPFAITVNEGKYVGLEASRYNLADIYQLLHQHQIIANVQASYPIEALQMRIEHVG